MSHSTYAGVRFAPLPICAQPPKPEWSPPGWWREEYFEAPLYEYKTKEQLQGWFYRQRNAAKVKACNAANNAKRTAKRRAVLAAEEERRPSQLAQLEIALLLAAADLKTLEAPTANEYLAAVLKTAEARQELVTFANKHYLGVPESAQQAPLFERVLVHLCEEVTREERNIRNYAPEFPQLVASCEKALKQARERLTAQLNYQLKQRNQPTATRDNY